MKTTLKLLFAASALCGCMIQVPALADTGSSRSVTTAQTTTVSQTSVTEASLSPVLVAALQEQLKEKGYFKARVDGQMGTETRDAIASFQSAEGLPANGATTVATLDDLGIYTGGTTVATASAVSPENIEPAAGGDSDVVATTSLTYETGDVRLNTRHENGASCMTCTNGIIGNGNTPSMRSTEY
jgi:peptidoglycan hydrolase-like protein with peptidoglycan-binding domain